MVSQTKLFPIVVSLKILSLTVFQYTTQHVLDLPLHIQYR